MTDTSRRGGQRLVPAWDWEARREVLREGFRTLRPDLVALQETVVTDQMDQTADLFGATPQPPSSTHRSVQCSS